MKTYRLVHNVLKLHYLIVFLLLFSNHSSATLRTVGSGQTYSTINTAISAAANGDTIWIVGGTYSEDVPINLSLTNLTFMGSNASPDNFPSLQLTGSNWGQWQNNSDATRAFRRVILNNTQFVSGSVGNNRKLYIDRCVVSGWTSGIMIQLADNSPVNAVEIDNTVFLNNSGGTLIQRPNNLNSNGPWAKIFNSTFYGNASVYAGNAISSTDSTNLKFITITNSIFKNNTTICTDTKVTKGWNYNLIPTAEVAGNWGGNYVRNDNPGFVSGTPAIASDLKITSGSPAKDAGTNTGAQSNDIAGQSRTGTYDIGAWEYVAAGSSIYTWDNSTSAGIQTGNGTWGTNNYWTLDGTNLVAWPGAGNTAVFAGSDGAYTITVNGTQNVDSIAFLNDGYTLTGGTVNLGSKNGINEASGTGTINSVISGTNGIAKYGTGQLTLGGTNTFTGASTLTAGKTKITSINGLGATGGSATVNSGAVLVLDGNLTFASENLNINGTGVDGSAFRTTTSGDRTCTWPGNITLQSASTVSAYTAASILTLSGVISGGYQLKIGGSGTVVLSGANTYSGGTTISSGTLQVGASASLPSATVITIGNNDANNAIFDLNGYNQTIGGVVEGGSTGGTKGITNNGSGAATLTVNNSSDYSFSYVVTNAANALNLTKNGTGKLTLSGTNINHTGVNTISNGTLTFSDATSLANGTSTASFSIASGKTLEFYVSSTHNIGSTYASGTVISGTGTLQKTGSGLLALGNQGSTSNKVYMNMTGGLIDIQAGTLRNGGWQGGQWTNNKASMNIASGAKFDLWDGNTAYVDALTGAGNVDQSTFAPGTINMAVGVNNGSGTFSGTFTESGGHPVALTKNGSGTQILTGNSSYTGGTTISDGTLQLGNGGTSGIITGNVTDNATLVFNRSDNIKFSGSISGSGAVTQSGSGIDTLSASNSYSGATTVNSGTLVLQNQSSSTSFSIASGTTLEYNLGSDINYTANTSFSGAGTLKKTGSAKAEWTTGAATFSLSSGSLIDVEGGTFVGGSNANDVWTNNYSDLTVASGATFRGVEANVRVDALNGAGTIKSGYNGSGYVNFTFGVDNGSGTFSGVLADDNYTGNFVKNGNGTQVLSGTNTYTGTTTISAGILQIGNGGTSGSIAGNITDNATLVFNRSDNVTYSGIISGSGAVTQAGSGTVTLSGTNTYSGGTAINAGTIQMGDNSTVGSENVSALGTGLVTINTGGTLWPRPGSTGNTYNIANSFAVNGGTIIGQDGVQHLATGAGATFAIGASGATVLSTWSGKDVYIDGIISGSTTLTLSHGPTAGSAATIHITNSANTFSGTVVDSTFSQNMTLSLDNINALQYATLRLASSSGTPYLQLGSATANATTTIAGLTGTAGYVQPSTSAGTYTLNVNTAGTNTFNGVLQNNTGVLALIKAGAGTLTLGGTNTYTGTTSVNAGTLVVNGSLSSSSAVTVASGATLAGTGNAAGSVTIQNGGILQPGSNSAAKFRTGALTLNGTSVLNWDIGTASDTVAVTGNLALNGTINITDAGGLTLGQYTILTYTGTLSGSGLTIGTVPYGLTASISTATANKVILTLSAINFTWDVSTSTGIQDGNGTWGTDNYWTPNGQGTILVAWPGAGSSATFVNSSGNWTVTVNGTQNVDSISFVNNGYTLSGGTLNLGSKNGINVESGKIGTINSIISGTNGIIKYGPGELDLGGNNSFTGAASVSAGKLKLLSANGLGATSEATTINSGAAILLTSSSPLTYAAEHLYINGTGIQYPGALRTGSGVNDTITWPGIVTLQSASSIGATDNADQLNVSGVIEGGFQLTTDGPGTIILSGTNTYSGGTIINAGTLQIGNGGTSGVLPGNVTNNSALIFNRSDALTYSGVISGTGSLTQTGSSALTLSGANTYSGNTIVNGGDTLVVANNTALGNNTGTLTVYDGTSSYSYLILANGITVTGKTVTLNSSHNQRSIITVASGNTATWNGTITLAGTTDVFQPDGTLNIQGTVNGSCSYLHIRGNGVGNLSATVSIGSTELQKWGTSPWTISSTGNTWGNTSIYTGTLVLGASSALPSSTILQIGRSGSSVAFDMHSYNQTVAGLTQTDTSTSCTSQITNSGASASTLTINNTSNYTFCNKIKDSTSIINVVKNGSGTLTFSGTNTYTGTTTISAGNLCVTGSTVTGSAITVASGATLSGTGNASGPVTIQNSGILKPGNSSAAKFQTGALTLNSTSALNWDIGTASDTVAVTGDLILDGTLNITAGAGYRVGTYTIMTYTGLLTDNGLSISSVPSGYNASITTSGGSVRLVLDNSSEALLPLTVVQSTPRCSVYTKNWTLVFDNGAGGGINVLTDSIHGLSHGQGNQINAATQNLYYIYYDGSSSKTNANGTWSVLTTGTFYTQIRQSGTLAGLPYYTDYTIHGSGKMYIKTTLVNSGGADVTAKTVRCVSERRTVTNMSASTGNGSANLSPFTLLSSDSSKQNDILLSTKDLWNTSSGAPNSATGFYNNAGSGYAGYECTNVTINAGQRQSWEYMVDFSHTGWNDTSWVGQYSDDYRTPDSLAFISGTPAFDEGWEKYLFGNWKLDETGACDTARDFSGNNFHGAASGTWTTGKLGGGLLLNGSQGVTVANNSAFSGTPYFVAMTWLKLSANLSSSTVIMGKHDGSNGWKLTGDASQRLCLTLNGTAVSAKTAISTGTWHHVAVCWVKSLDSITFYLDGRVDKSIKGALAITTNTANLLIGNGITGTIDDARFFGNKLSENDIKCIYQNGYRSSEGFYMVRASNDNSINLTIDGGTITRRFPVFLISNYWATSKPSAGCVVFNGVTLTEGTDYYANLDDRFKNLVIGFNKIVYTDSLRIYVDDNNPNGARAVIPTPKMSWGIATVGSVNYFWAKNFNGTTFSGSTSNQWFMNWKMNNATTNSRCGEIYFLASSVTNPNAALDTTKNTNLIPTDAGYNSTPGNYTFNMGGQYIRSPMNSGAFTYAVQESSSTRIVLQINDRTITNSGQSNHIVTRYTVYPTGQIFRWDSLSQFSSVPSQAWIGVHQRYSTNGSLYRNTIKKRCGIIYSSGYPDLASAFISFKNANGYQAVPFDSDTLYQVNDGNRYGYDFVDLTLPAVWNSTSIQTAVYIDMQSSNMSNAFVDSVSNSVQNIGIGGGAALSMINGTLVNTTAGDLNGDGFNESEGTYIVKADNNNTARFKLPAHGDTCRFYPAFRITGYIAASKPQYVYIYRGTDTVCLLENYQYNIYHDKANRQLILQIDSIFCDSVGIYISSDKTLAVELSKFEALSGNRSDTLLWRTESEQGNLGFQLFRRIKPGFYDSIANVINSSTISESQQHDSDEVISLFKRNSFNAVDTGWVMVNKNLIPGAPSGNSEGPRDYRYIDRNLFNGILFEYRLVAIDEKQKASSHGPVAVMPRKIVPAVFMLGANYPNPFVRSTIIRFALPVQSTVSLKIFTIQGRQVRHLIKPDRKYPADYHQVFWDGRDEHGLQCAAGPFIYILEAGKYSKARVMLMIR